MIRGIYSAAAGMAADLVKQDVLANNLANANTAGFKKDLAVYKTRSDQTVYRVEANGGARAGVPTVRKMGDLSTGVYLDQIATQFGQGAMNQTDEPLDLALSGPGYFVVQDANGSELLTRGGSFTKDKQGFITDASGRKLLGKNGPIRLANTGTLHVSNEGLVQQNGKNVAALRVVDVQRADETLEKRGDTAWSLKDAMAASPVGKQTDVKQGYLETSNVNPVREMVEMITVQRSYEASQHMITAQDETLGKAVNDLGRV